MQKRTISDGLLVVIEGIDGAGKTTLANSLKAAFEKGVSEVILTKEPTHGPWGEKLRATVHTERVSAAEENEWLLLDRQEHVRDLIKPALSRGAVVILDRYYYSTAAYQGASGLSPADIIAENETFAPKPDVLLLIDLDPHLGLQRIHGRGDKANSFEQESTLIRAREIFLQTAPPRPAARVIDGTLSAAEVLSIARQAIFEVIGNRLVANGPPDVDKLEQVLALMGD